MANAFIDKQQTRSFPAFTEAIGRASKGDSWCLAQLEQRRGWALERSKNTQQAIGDQSDALAELVSNFEGHELKELRAGRSLKSETRQKILALTTDLADYMQVTQFGGVHIFPPPYRYNQFVWRYTLCHVIQMMQLVRQGSKRRAPEKARNDHFDNVFATFGTFFNGVMTNDFGTLLTHEIARVILRSLGARLASPYNAVG